ncbi:MAG TPA: hypothetical protein PKO07_18950 [Pseudomonadota bacterium]|nr:hypothetical protein [Pseudomonadota bacterium]
MRRAWLQVAGLVRSAADIRLPSLLYGVSVTAPLPSGELLAIDTSAAETCPGVVCVLTADSALSGEAQRYAPLLRELFSSPIRHAGQIVALVVADSRSAALVAARKINLRVRSQSAHLTIAAALSADATGSLLRSQSGAAADAFAQSKTRFVQTYRLAARLAGWSGDGVATAVWRDGGLTLFTVGTPTPELLGRLGLAPERLLVLASSVGAEQVASGPQVLLAAIAALQLVRPVQVSVSSLAAAGVVCEQVQTVQLGLDDQDRPCALLLQSAIGTRHRLPSDALAAPTALGELYGFPAKELSVLPARVALPTTPPQMDGFAIDAAVDELAFLLSTDPLALRLRWLDGKDSLAAKTLRACLLAISQRMAATDSPNASKNVGVAAAIHCLPSGEVVVGAHCMWAKREQGRPRLVGHVCALGLLGIVDESAARPIIMRQIEKARRLVLRTELACLPRSGYTDEHPVDDSDASEVAVCDVMLLPAGFDRAPSVTTQAISALAESGVAAAALSALSLAIGERHRSLPAAGHFLRVAAS